MADGGRREEQDACPACGGTGWTSVEWIDRTRSEPRNDRALCESCGGGGGAEHYPDSADGPVRYLPVSRLAGVVGYLWASEHDDAAGYVRKLHGPDTYPFPGYRRWRRRLSQDKARGLRPLELLQRWTGEPRDPNAGGIAPEAEIRVAAGLPELERLAAEPDNYRQFSEAPVRYLPVWLHGKMIGYLWASTPAGAAGFVARKGSGTIGVQARMWWRTRLQEAYAAGFQPTEAIRVLAGGPEVPMAGHIPPDATEHEAASSRHLETAAARDVPEGAE